MTLVVTVISKVRFHLPRGISRNFAQYTRQGQLFCQKCNATMDLSAVVELLEEVIRCAEESDATSDRDVFVAFVTDMLPQELLNQLEEEDFNVEDIWKERFQPTELDNEEEEDGCCKICDRDMRLTRHHLIPRETHKRYLKQGKYTKEQLNQTAAICRMCHNAIHRFYTNMELAEHYNTVELLLQQDKIVRHAQWAARFRCR